MVEQPNSATQTRVAPFDRFWRAALVAVAGVALVVGVACAPGSAAAKRIDVRASDFAYEPKDIMVDAGEVTFAVRNVGAVEHNFVIEDKDGKTVAQIPNIRANQTLELKATLRAGAYKQICTLPGHADAGMVGTITVK